MGRKIFWAVVYFYDFKVKVIKNIMFFIKFLIFAISKCFHHRSMYTMEDFKKIHFMPSLPPDKQAQKAPLQSVLNAVGIYIYIYVNIVISPIKRLFLITGIKQQLKQR